MSPTSVRVIDFDDAGPRLVSEIDDAFQRDGFAAIRTEMIPIDVVSRMYEGVRAFFAQEESVKLRVRWPGSGRWRGYFPLEENEGSPKDSEAVERLEYGRAEIVAEAGALLTPGWPASPDGLEAVWRAYYASVEQFVRRFFEVMAGTLSFDLDTLTEWTENHQSNLSANCYPGYSRRPSSDTPGMKEHTDFGGLTVITAEGEWPRLEVHAQGGEWRTVSFDDGLFIIQAGDLLSAATGGRWSANLHRVSYNSLGDTEAARAVTGDRISIVYFHIPNPNSLAPIPGSEYTGLTVGEYISQRMNDY